jgi:hypothetical protein
LLASKSQHCSDSDEFCEIGHGTCAHITLCSPRKLAKIWPTTNRGMFSVQFLVSEISILATLNFPPMIKFYGLASHSDAQRQFERIRDRYPNDRHRVQPVKSDIWNEI